MDEAGEFGLKGMDLLHPSLTLDGQRSDFRAPGKHFEVDPDMHGMLTLIASYAIGRAIW